MVNFKLGKEMRKMEYSVVCNVLSSVCINFDDEKRQKRMNLNDKIQTWDMYNDIK